MKKTAGLFLICAMAAGMGAPILAAEEAAVASQARRFELPNPPVLPAGEGVVRKVVKGDVEVKIRSGMNVVYERDRGEGTSREMWVEFTKGIAVLGVKDVAEFEPGDRVEVMYEQNESGTKRVFKKIALLKRKSASEKAAEAAREAAEALKIERSAPSEEVLRSDE